MVKSRLFAAFAFLFGVGGAALTLSLLAGARHTSAAQAIEEHGAGRPAAEAWQQERPVKVIVDAGDAEALASLAAAGGEPLVDYGAFQLWSMPEAKAQALAARSSIAVRADFDTIALREAIIDIPASGEGPEPDVPANLRQSHHPWDAPGSPVESRKGRKMGTIPSAADGPQFWMVQFVGPIKPEWLSELQDAGLEIVIYMPQNAYVVWGESPGRTLQALAALQPAIQWDGPYHPAYRLAPSLQKAAFDAAPGTPVDVTVQFYTTHAVDASLKNLLALGGAVHKSPETILVFRNVTLQLPADRLVEVANWPDVFNVEPWFAPQMLDEIQNQILAGNVTHRPPLGVSSAPGEAGGATGKVLPGGPGYLAWLASKGFPTQPSSYPIVDIVDDGIDQGNANSVLHPDFHELGSPANPDRVVYLVNCTIDSSANGQGGHGNLNAGIVGSYNNLGGAPHVDAGGYRIGLGMSPYGRIAGTKIFRNSDSYSIVNCGGTDSGVVAASYNNGAHFTSNSWGDSLSSGRYDTSAQAYDALTRDASGTTAGNQQMLHIFAAGNAGPGADSIGSPATAKNVLAVGATENVRDDGIADGLCNVSNADSADDIATFSSRGPTDDGRVKPELMAPGTHVQGPASQDPGFDGDSVCGGPDNDGMLPPADAYYPARQTLYTWSSGTSHSTPAVAGAASLVWEYYGRVLRPGQPPTGSGASPAMLKALLINSARYLNGQGTGGTLPSNQQGWGDVNLGRLFDGTPYLLVDQNQMFTATGQVLIYGGAIGNPANPFRVTLAWTDPPGSTTGNAYVNDLDLEVIAGGVTYRGNVFSGATSTTGGSADSKNNVESVFLPAGLGGGYTVRVIARNLASDGVPGNGLAIDQDFALVVYNNSIGPAGTLAGRVTDSATSSPIALADVVASSSPTQTFSVKTNAAGDYRLLLPAGTYTLSVSAYAYQPATIGGVSIVSGTTTTQNVALAPAPTAVVSGTVRDAKAGWPLYAGINIEGYPGGTIWNDPVSGYYSVTLAQGIPYTFNASAWVFGYKTAFQPIGPLAGDRTENIGMAADEDLCIAPGFQPEFVYLEDFELSNGGYVTSVAFITRTTSWQWGVPTSGPRSAHSGSKAWATNLSGNYTVTEDGYLTSPNIDLSAYAGQTPILQWWQWLVSERCCDHASVQVSKDGGASWTPVYGEVSGQVSLSWTKINIALDPSYSVNNFQVRFRFRTDTSLNYPGWYIDDVGIGVVTPPPKTIVFSRDFESGGGGFITSTASMTRTTSWRRGTPASGPGSAHSGTRVWATNPISNYGPNEDGYLTSGNINLSAFTGTGQAPTLSWWQWLQTQPAFDFASIEVSKDGGASWTRVYGEVSGNVDLQWRQRSVTLDESYLTSSFRLRFRFRTNAITHYPGWYIDDVEVSVAPPFTPTMPCLAAPGGLVIGNTFDADSGAPLPGVTIRNDSGRETASAVTVDPAVADSFYTLFSPAGRHVFSATLSGYGVTTATPTVVQSNTIRQDFVLGKGQLSYAPSSVRVTLELGKSATAALTLSNSGSAATPFELSEVDLGFEPIIIGPVRSADAPETPAPSPPRRPIVLSLSGPPRSGRQPPTGAIGGQPAAPWTPSGPLALVLDDGTAETSIGLSTGGPFVWFNRFTPAPDDFPMVIDQISLLFNDTVAISDDLQLVIWEDTDGDGDPNTGTRLVYTQNAGALINDFVTWNVYNLISPVQLNGPGDVLIGVVNRSGESGYLDYPAAVDKGASQGRSWIGAYSAGDPPDPPALPADDLWGVIDDFDLAGNWTLRASGYTGGLGVAWLSEAPVSGTLAPSSSRSIALTFDAGALFGAGAVDQPGVYAAELQIQHNTPFSLPNVPISLTVNAPPAWGQIHGRIYGLGYCDGSVSHLKGARILLSYGDGMTKTLTQGEGVWSWWLPAGQVTITASAPNYVTQTVASRVVAGEGTNRDVNLRLAHNCGSAEPAVLDVRLPPDGSASFPISLTNSGTLPWAWSLSEDSTWLSITGLVSGTTAPDSRLLSEIRLDTTGMLPGSKHTALIGITHDDDLAADPVQVMVRLSVQGSGGANAYLMYLPMLHKHSP